MLGQYLVTLKASDEENYRKEKDTIDLIMALELGMDAFDPKNDTKPNFNTTRPIVNFLPMLTNELSIYWLDGSMGWRLSKINSTFRVRKFYLMDERRDTAQGWNSAEFTNSTRLRGKNGSS